MGITQPGGYYEKNPFPNSCIFAPARPCGLRQRAYYDRSPVDDTPAVSPDTTPETPEEDEPVVEEPVEETPEETPSEEVPAEDETPATSELETMVNTIVEGVNIEPAMMHEDISADRYWWYFGSETPLEGFEAHGYEAMISAIP